MFGQFLLFSYVKVLAFGSGCHRIRQTVEVNLFGREPIQAGVRSDGVVELDVATDQSPGFVDRLVAACGKSNSFEKMTSYA